MKKFIFFIYTATILNFLNAQKYGLKPVNPDTSAAINAKSSAPFYQHSTSWDKSNEFVDLNYQDPIPAAEFEKYKKIRANLKNPFFKSYGPGNYAHSEFIDIYKNTDNTYRILIYFTYAGSFIDQTLSIPNLSKISQAICQNTRNTKKSILILKCNNRSVFSVNLQSNQVFSCKVPNKFDFSNSEMNSNYIYFTDLEKEIAFFKITTGEFKTYSLIPQADMRKYFYVRIIPTSGNIDNPNQHNCFFVFQPSLHEDVTTVFYLDTAHNLKRADLKGYKDYSNQPFQPISIQRVGKDSFILSNTLFESKTPKRFGVGLSANFIPTTNVTFISSEDFSSKLKTRLDYYIYMYYPTITANAFIFKTDNSTIDWEARTITYSRPSFLYFDQALKKLPLLNSNHLTGFMNSHGFNDSFLDLIPLCTSNKDTLIIMTHDISNLYLITVVNHEYADINSIPYSALNIGPINFNEINAQISNSTGMIQIGQSVFELYKLEP